MKVHGVQIHLKIKSRSDTDYGRSILTLPVPIPGQDKIFFLIFIFTRLCDASKGFMKALKAFIKPSEGTQRSVKIKI